MRERKKVCVLLTPSNWGIVSFVLILNTTQVRKLTSPVLGTCTVPDVFVLQEVGLAYTHAIISKGPHSHNYHNYPSPINLRNKKAQGHKGKLTAGVVVMAGVFQSVQILFVDSVWVGLILILFL